MRIWIWQIQQKFKKFKIIEFEIIPKINGLWNQNISNLLIWNPLKIQVQVSNGNHRVNSLFWFLLFIVATLLKSYNVWLWQIVGFSFSLYKWVTGKEESSCVKLKALMVPCPYFFYYTKLILIWPTHWQFMCSSSR